MNCQCDLEQYVVRLAGGAAAAGADPPFNFTVDFLAVLHSCFSEFRGLCSNWRESVRRRHFAGDFKVQTQRQRTCACADQTVI